MPFVGPPSNRRLSDCPSEAFSEYPKPTDHRDNNGGEIEESENASTHDTTSGQDAVLSLVWLIVPR
jgi:hypothetical protein